jgi:hypothetical protein
VKGDWRKLHNEELYNLRFTTIIRRMIWAGHVAHMGGMRNTRTYRTLVGKPGGKRLLGRLWSRWEDNIEIEIQTEIGFGLG